MAVLRAVVSDRDGIIHELVLRKRENSAGYNWFYGDVALAVTPATTLDDALRILKQEISPPRNEGLQFISLTRDADDQV